MKSLKEIVQSVKENLQDKPTESEQHWLLKIWGDTEPELVPCADLDDVYARARKHRAEEDPGRQDGQYKVAVNWDKRTLTIDAFCGGDFPAPEGEAE